MIPSGLANFFGILAIGKYPGVLVLSSLVLMGFVLLIPVLLQTVADVRKGRLYAYLLSFMFVVGIVFFRGANDYGLFKLAMFCQPALAACFSFLALRIFRGWWRVAPVLVLAATVPAQTYYTAVSAGLIHGSVLEVPEMSYFGLVFAVPRITAISDIDIKPAQGLAAIVFRGSVVLYPSVARWKFNPGSEPSNHGPVALAGHQAAVTKSGLTRTDGRNGGKGAEHAGSADRAEALLSAPEVRIQHTGIRPPIRLIDSKPPGKPINPGEAPSRLPTVHSALSVRERIKSLVEALGRATAFPTRKFARAGDEERGRQYRQMNQLENVWGTDFFQFAPDLLKGQTTHLLTLQREFLFNETSQLEDTADYGIFRLAPYDKVQNWLLFIPSTRGLDYYQERFGASFYQPEVDIYRPVGYMSAVGRFFLMQVLHPTDRVRLRVSLSRSILGQERVLLPRKAVTYGGSIETIPFVGAGSAAVYSDPITPLWKNGYAYLALDLGESPTAFPNIKTGLMKLYNQEIPIDSRRLVAFGRDISAISEEEYRNLARPRRIASFPAGLLSDRGLEYSGIYEDGWVSQESFVKLGASEKDEKIIIEGTVPSLEKLATGRLTVQVQVDGAPTETHTLKPGSFQLSVRLREAAPVTTVHIAFSDSASLPGGDGRPVSALLHSVSIR